jgi:long-chain acyl-CoA synthetase
MPNFLENTFAQLQQASGRVVLREIRGTEFVSVSGAELLDQVARVRTYLRGVNLEPGDRCALLGPNSIRWAAIDLALMAEGLVVVPLYSRQAHAELTAMMKDCSPRLLIASEAALGDSVAQVWPEAPPRTSFDEIFPTALPEKGIAGAPHPRQGETPQPFPTQESDP